VVYDSRIRLESFSRDPIGYAGSLWNLYEFVDSAPLVKSDPSGNAALSPLIPGQCSYRNFMRWVTDETDSLASWVSKIKPCPCTLKCKLKYCDGTIEEQVICKTRPQGFGLATQTGTHPGSEYDYRENSCENGWDTPGNQCTYGADGRLLTTHPGGGTADRYGGGCGMLGNPNHLSEDVIPWQCAQSLENRGHHDVMGAYERVRPINGGKPCDATERVFNDVVDLSGLIM